MLKFSFLPFLVLLTSCWKEPVYPDTPQIEFKSSETRFVPDELSNNGAMVNIVKVTWTFKDGDGDLGLSDEDVKNPPFDDQNGANPFHHNVFFEAFIEKDGEYVPTDLSVANIVKSHFLRLSNSDSPMPLEGEITYTFTNLGFMPPFFKSGDHIKLRIQIADRAKNLSNKIETDPIPIFFQ